MTIAISFSATISQAPAEQYLVIAKHQGLSEGFDAAIAVAGGVVANRIAS